MNAYTPIVVPLGDAQSLAVHTVNTNAPVLMDAREIHAIRMDLHGLTLIRTNSSLFHDLHETSYIMDDKVVHDEPMPDAGLVEVFYRNYSRVFEALRIEREDTNIPVFEYDWEEIEEF